ncbi:MAG: cobyric acid synthase [Chloroflexi bacterium]|nr:cobyric acid synthase [Chloroflexota bacterium]
MQAPVIMIQGTSSHVGKSVIAAGLCRLLRDRGLRVAPFKAVNMSLNAAVTPDGGEIARSTAVQAAAAGIEPTVDMNPVLLKPEAGGSTQVVIRGRVHGRTRYGLDPPAAAAVWPVIAESLDRLRRQYDLIVAEGAGSPAEMNLRDRDLANMRVALYADAAVILVADIDRGGVFARIIGTLELLPPRERALVRGLIINRFMGDPALFADGVRFLEERTGRPVLGVIPYMRDLGLAEEDAAVLDAPRPAGVRTDDGQGLRVAVVRLPRLANFDEFDPLARRPGVTLAYVDRPGQLADADLIILPGTKSTVADLAFLRARGLATAITAARARGTPIIGICGGYQMLGREIADPAGVEAPAGCVRGLGLLDHSTIFGPEKVTCRVRVRLVARTGPFALACGAEAEGYEIHAGRPVRGESAAPLRIVRRGGAAADEPEGALSEDGLVLGTSVHGLLASPTVCDALLAWLTARARPGTAARGTGTPLDLDTACGRWAAVLAGALDLPALLAHCGLTVSGRRA